MKKSTLSVIVIIVLIIIGIVVFGRSSSTPTASTAPISTSTVVTVSAPATEITTSGKTSVYKNDELGFQVSYPSAWERDDATAGVTFVMPIDKTQVSTIAKLQADINVFSGKCAFPPVTTIKDRGTATIAGQKANMITMTNTVQGRSYFDRMYSLENGSVCYIFHFSSISQSPDAQKLSGSNLTQATNNNKAIVATADAAFTTMVKSFAFVSTPAGQDETTAAPAQK